MTPGVTLVTYDVIITVQLKTDAGGVWNAE